VLGREDFEALYAEEAAGLFSFLAYRSGDRALAEDLVADTFERALRSRRRFDPRKGRRKTWLYAIAVNLLRDSARKRASEGRAMERVMVEVPAAGPAPQTLVEDRDEVRHALETLSTEEQDVIALRFGGDLTVPEIARVTGESLPAVESRVYRALKKLRERLDS